MNRKQTPARLRHAVALAVGLGCSSVAASIGLGPIQVNSSIGQPMSATIRVDGLDAATAKGATVQLASAAAYRARGIELLPIHQKLRFSLVPSGKGYVIRVTSTTGIREPFLNFLLTINSNGSTITREYAAFFNQDPLNPGLVAPTLADVSESKGAASPATKTKCKKGKKCKETAQEAEQIAAVQPAKSQLDFRASNLNNREVTSVEDETVRNDRIAAEKEVAKAKAKEAREAKELAARKAKEKERLAQSKKLPPLRAVSPNSEGWGGHDVLAGGAPKQTPPPSKQSGDGRYTYYSADVKPGSIAVGSTYGPVRDNETLFSIANAARPSEDVSIQQMMRAIYNANRGSFAHNNMGNLMVGSTLVIPDPGAATAPVPAKAVRNTDIAANDKPAKKEKKTDSAPGKTEIAKADIPVKTEEPIAAATPGAENDIAANAAQNPPIALVQNDTPAENVTPPENNVQMDGNQLTLDNSETLVADNSKAAESPAAPATEQNPEEQSAALPVQAEKTVEVAAANEPAAPPAIPAMESKPVVAVVEEQPTDKVSTGMPLPLLAAAGVGVLGLGGAAAYFITHRRRRDDDSMEEFSQDEIDQMVSEMEAREGVKAGHDMEAGDPKPRRKAEPVAGHDPVADLEGLQQLNGQLSELEKLNEQIGIPRFVDDGEPHSAEELPDDFFKDLQLPGEEEAVPVAAAPQPAAAEEEHDFFSDLEAFAAEEPTAASTGHSAAATQGTDFDLPDFGLDEAPAAAAPAAKPSLAKAEPTAQPAAAEADDFDFLNFAADESAVKAEPASQPAAAADDDLDFLSFSAVEPVAKEEPASQTTATDDSDDFDFISFAAEELAASEPVAAAKAEPAAQAAADDGDDFDFISFATEEPAAPTVEETTATASASTGDDDLDFFNSLSLADDSSASAPAAAAEPEIVDEDHNVLDFFGSDEEPVPVVAEEAPVAAEKPAVVHTHSVVSDAVVVAAPAATKKAESEALDFFSLQDEPAATQAAATPQANIQDTVTPQSTQTVAATIAPASSEIDVEAMEINLDMATSFIVMGKAEKARSWLDEVLISGSEAQKIRARSMLEQLEKA